MLTDFPLSIDFEGGLSRPSSIWLVFIHRSRLEPLLFLAQIPLIDLLVGQSPDVIISLEISQ